MRWIYKTLTALLSMGMLLMSCNDDKPFSVAGPDDEPHILAPIFPDRNNGALPVVVTSSRDANFAMELTVTPADYVEVVWYLDGHEVATGKKIDIPLLAGVYHLKVEVTTPHGKSTSREGIVRVNPLEGDPWAIEADFERIISPGTTALLYGTNLELVKAMKIGEKAVSDFALVTEDDNTHISYTVPSDMDEGEQRIILIDADGIEYGGNMVTVSSSALITTGADRATANSEWIMTGINLDKIAFLKLGDVTISDFAIKTATMLQFISPALEDGEYALTGKMTDGRDVTFFKNKQVESETNVVVSSQHTLWSGHHYVSWDLPDDSPNKTFNLISQDVFASIKPGAVMSIHYSIEPAAEYHQIRTTSGWWADLPGTAVVEVSSDGVLEITLTQSVLDAIMEQSGFLCVGHGYFVDLVTLK